MAARHCPRSHAGDHKWGQLGTGGNNKNNKKKKKSLTASRQTAQCTSTHSSRWLGASWQCSLTAGRGTCSCSTRNRLFAAPGERRQNVRRHKCWTRLEMAGWTLSLPTGVGPSEPTRMKLVSVGPNKSIHRPSCVGAVLLRCWCVEPLGRFLAQDRGQSAREATGAWGT